MRNIVFRTDASLTIGIGHVMRCLTLAEALREQDTMVSFICREHDGHLCELIRQRGFSVKQLPAPKAGTQVENIPAHAAWLGAPWQEDAEQTCAAIKALDAKFDWLVVDHYAIDQHWENALRPVVKHIMVIDDLADRVHDCDLLLDQNLVAQMHTRYTGKIPAPCTVLLGTEYALLQPIYAELHGRTPPRKGALNRILIFFGGADNDNLTGRTLAAFLSLNRSDIRVDVIITSGSPNAEIVRQQVAGQDNIHLHSSLPTLAPLMAMADLAIGAGGATNWERLCLGLPTLVITLAENQRPIADGLSQHDLIHWLGHRDKTDEQTIAQALSKLLQQNLDEDWSLRCLAAVDGKGVIRVCAVLTVSATTQLQIRHVTLKDEAMLLTWANDLETRNNSFHQEMITVETHRAWFRDRLRNLDGCRFYIAEIADGIALGQVRFERQEYGWEIHYALTPMFHGRNLDHSLLEAAFSRFRSDIPGMLLFNQVKSADPYSRKMPEMPDSSSRYKKIDNEKPWAISVCSDASSWINASIPQLLIRWLAEGHKVTWVHDADVLPSGDICFYLSYGRIVNNATLARHKNNLVVHASDLPRGRGWSPLTWQILEGKNQIPVTLLEAAEAVDSGPIYKQVVMEFSGQELIDELRLAVSHATQELCQYFVSAYPEVASTGIPQKGVPTFYARRRPEDSQLDINRSLREQFNLLRTADSEYYPAWFKFENKRFSIRIKKLDIQSKQNTLK